LSDRVHISFRFNIIISFIVGLGKTV